MQKRFWPAAMAVVVLTGALAAAEPGRDSRTATYSVTVELGDDLGQSLGSVFEARDAQGRLIAGAGFHDVYNTHFRTNHRVLQFFVRPGGAVLEPAIERLPHPDIGTGVYLLEVDRQLYAYSAVGGNSVRRWDAEAGEWRAELPAGVSAIRSGDGETTIGNGRLLFADDQAWYDGELILSQPESGGRHHFYYANGYLCFYHRKEGNEGAFTHICACRWFPGDGPINSRDTIVLDTKYEHETTFAWGQWDDQVLTVSNVGGVYVLDGDEWRVLRDPDRMVSYQVYSMIRWRDRLLLAHYPTGHVFEYRGDAAPQELADWPPRLAGASPSARECQTLAIHGGDLYAGVWPWAELWRLDGTSDQWTSLGRMFTHPAVSDRTVHPYEEHTQEFDLVLNHWGQRVSGLMPMGDSLYVATSSKGTAEWRDEYTFLSETQRREYGALLRLRIPGNVAAPIRWPSGRTELRFVVDDHEIRIEQDGEKLTSTPFKENISASLDQQHVAWGDGVHGPLRGDIVEASISAGK